MKAYPVWKCRKCGQFFSSLVGIELTEEEKQMTESQFYSKKINEFEVQIHEHGCIRLKDSKGHESEYWKIQAHVCDSGCIGFGDIAGVELNHGS
jgi:hypothetical protein